MQITTLFPQRRAAGQTAVPLYRNWLLLPVILVLVTALVVWQTVSAATPAAVQTAAVTQGSLTVAVSGSGAVSPARQVALPFQQSGTVTSVDVQVGDQVKTNQALAKLDTGNLQLQLAQAKASLAAAQAKLAQATGGGATPQDLASAQASVQSAKAQLAKVRTGNVTAADLASAQAQLTAAQARIDALKNPSPASISAAQTKVSQAQSALQNTRDGDSQAKTNAQLALQNAVDGLTQAQSRYATAKQNWDYVQETGNDPTQPTKTSASGKAVANKLNDTQRQQYYDTFVQAQAGLDSAQNGVAQAQVNYDTARQKEATDVPQAEAALQDAQQQLAALLNPTPTDIAQAQAQVTQAQASLTKLRQGGTPADIAQAQAQVTQAQANLDKLSAPAATADIAAAQAGVAQAQVQVDAAQRALDQATLTAPFDGVVAAVGVQAGGVVSGSTAAVTLVDRSTLHIDLNLSETDAARVQVGQPVTLTFDALQGTTLTGKVVTVAPAATVQQNVVTYPVQVEFDPGTTPIKVGMSATADIQVQQVDNAILVPSRAVQTVGTARVVTVLYGPRQVPVQVEVLTGASANGQVAITSCVATGGQCLQPGDVLALPSATQRTSQAGQGGPGGFGGQRGGIGLPFGGGR